jgi:hypothetical protein
MNLGAAALFIARMSFRNVGIDADILGNDSGYVDGARRYARLVR